MIDTAFDEGKLKGKLEVAKALKQNGVAIQIIISSTVLSVEEINNL